ncbi:MAG TPA: DUF418 domain-containing protein [Gemmataceae bacterium]
MTPGSITASPDWKIAAAPTMLTPVGSGERIASIDVLRGVALLGILTINIWGFALPSVVFLDPRAAGGWDAPNRTVWTVCHLLFEQKMMSLFSMLFGAGLIVMMSRSDARGSSLTGIYYRRIFWLLVFGLLHAYLLWEGDILVSYALCGFVLFLFRRLRPRTQIALGVLVFLTQLPLIAGLGLLEERLRAVTGPDAKEGPAWAQELRRSLEENLFSSDAAEEIEKHREGYSSQFVWRAVNNVGTETGDFLFWAGPRAGGLMLVGMGLMQLGVFAAARSYRFYARLAAAGYALGFPLVSYGIYDNTSHHFDAIHQFLVSGHFNYVGSLFVALGHVGVVMLICKAGLATWLTSRLAAVGRMALSNYLLQTVLCTTLFEGWGFSLYGRLERVQLLGVVLGVWLVQLIVSPLWLRWFRFGPMEWLWRSLTYGKIYSLRAPSAATPLEECRR